MPIYLCNPGENEPEPWRHGIQVYSTPFDLDSSSIQLSSLQGSGRDLIAAAAAARSPLGDALSSLADLITDQPRIMADNHLQNQSSGVNNNNNNNSTASSVRNRLPAAVNNAADPVEENPGSNRQQERREVTSTRIARTAAIPAHSNNNNHHLPSSSGSTTGGGGSSSNPHHPIRRVRHAEVVLVDDVCIAYSRFWLRLRWPGYKGGFAGYIAMSKVPDSYAQEMQIGTSKVDFSKIRSSVLEEKGDVMSDMDDPTRDDVMVATPPSEPFDSSNNECLKCARTGLKFQTSTALKLLSMYDDGIMPRVTLAPFPTEQIFCRICREGLHEDADTDQPNAATEDADNPVSTTSQNNHNNNKKDSNDDEDDDGYTNSEGGGGDGRNNRIRTSEPYPTIGPVLPHPIYNSNPDALQNPMLAPCQCSGSMAFVHYLCVEQWRCRSKHPDAHKGLNCETCSKPYALPPPSERYSTDTMSLEQEDWLEAMPPHVMQALRQPHIWWQIGSAIVRRKWLRPLAPIFMSPIVALYCRARRLLKKRGVARRRWACSLCRRRARWKCVRCLRSYYCSRQCQNVSWHIIHKHVCYKPVRFWWSVVVYGIIALLVFPGILRDPLMYDIGICLFPVSFVIMGVLGGGFASSTKRITGFDVRGRFLELLVLVCTIWLCVVTWGLIQGFFGMSHACYGTFGPYTYPSELLPNALSILRPFRWAILKPAEQMYLFWDHFIYHTKWLRYIFCNNNNHKTTLHHPTSTSTNTVVVGESGGCFEHLPYANANFITKANGGENCASDLLAVILLYLLAGGVFAGSTLLKHNERQRRRRLQLQQQQQQRMPPPRIGQPQPQYQQRLHQD